MRSQRGLTLITALAIVAIFLAIALAMLDLVTHNGENVNNNFQKQQYYDVAEAGIDRALADIDSTLPAIGSTAAPGTPPPAPSLSTDQTALPTIPNITYHYSYWQNATSSATSTPDPIPNYIVPSHTITVPANGILIWSYTNENKGRDVAIEEIATIFNSTNTGCGLCAGGNINLSGNNGGNASPVPSACQVGGTNVKICGDVSPAPSASPVTYVPLVMGGTYNDSPPPSGCTGTCAFGDGTSTPTPGTIVQNAPASTIAGFMDPPSVINQLSDSSAWSTLASGNPNVKYVNCSSGCSTNNINGTNEPAAGHITYLDGNVSLSANSTVFYSGEYIVNGCLTMSGHGAIHGGPNATTYSPAATVIVLGTDAACGGDAFSISGNALWDGGTLNVVQGSVSINGTGSTKYQIFYGDIIAAGSITLTGNGTFAYQAGLNHQTSFFGRYSVASFAQY